MSTKAKPIQALNMTRSQECELQEHRVGLLGVCAGPGADNDPAGPFSWAIV